MELSREGAAFIKAFEACRLCTYDDGFGYPTIGWGHHGLDVRKGMAITQTQADIWFDEDVAVKVYPCLRQPTIVTAPLNQNQFDALCSLIYNIGCGAFMASTLLKMLNARDYKGAAGQFIRWVYASGKETPGLIKRRKAESDLFMTPTSADNGEMNAKTA